MTVKCELHTVNLPRYIQCSTSGHRFESVRNAEGNFRWHTHKEDNIFGQNGTLVILELFEFPQI